MRILLAPALAGVLAAQSNCDALFQRAREAQMAGRTAEAEAGYREYIKRFGATPEALANPGVLLAQRENDEEAIRNYEHALKLQPSLAPLHLNLGLAWLKQGQMASALRELDLFLKAQPDPSGGLQSQSEPVRL